MREGLTLANLLAGELGKGSGLKSPNFLVAGGGGSRSVQPCGPPDICLQAWLRPGKPGKPNLPSPSPILA